MSTNDCVSRWKEVDATFESTLISLIDSIRILDPNYADYFKLVRIMDGGWKIDWKKMEGSRRFSSIKEDDETEKDQNSDAHSGEKVQGPKRPSLRKRLVNAMRRLFKLKPLQQTTTTNHFANSKK